MTTSHALLAVLLGAAAVLTDAAVMDAPKTAAATKVSADSSEVWWHTAIFYQIYPRSFMDSNGDGIGDLNGITSKLEHLKEIGVQGVWLSPFYPSPQKDFGYDISDFKNVDPTYGTMEDFKTMAAKAHKLGLKVVVDLVPNHSSDKHEWFQKSVKRVDPYTDYYVWKDGKMDADGKMQPPNNWVSHFRFSAWEWNEDRKQYYLHQFVPEQPDLNYDSPHVVQEMKDVFTFWMNNGVDGFRIDALPFLFETNFEMDEPIKPNQTDPDLNEDDYEFYTHPYSMDQEGTYDMLTQWRSVVDNHDKEQRVIMTECYTTFDNTMRYYGTKDKPGASFPFNFKFISDLNKSSTAGDIKAQIDEFMEGMAEDDIRKPNWVIGNHDNPRAATRFPNLADGMNMISLTLPGAAMTYYGEELGMTDAFITWKQTKDPAGINGGEAKYLKFTRDPCRTPMQWDDSVSAGFSKNNETWMPTNPNYWQCNVKAETSDSKSHLNVYKDLTKARQTDTMKKGDLSTKVMNEDLLVLTRSLKDSDTFITVVNLGSWERTISSSDLMPDTKLFVYTASGNSALKKGDAFSTATVRPKGGLVLSTSGASVAQAGALLSLVLAVLCLRV